MPVLLLPGFANMAYMLSSTSNLCLSYIRMEKSKVGRLPPEILREIFLFALFSPTSDELTTKGGVTNTPVISSELCQSPFTLSQTCRSWRDVIIRTPSIWSTISIYAPTTKHMYRIQTWISRSSSQSLDVELKQSTDPIEDEYQATDLVLQLLSGHVHRWRSITFHFKDIIPSSLPTSLQAIQRRPSSAIKLRIADILVRHTLSPDTPPLDLNSQHNTAIESIYSSLNEIPGLRKLVWVAPTIPHAHFGAQLQYLEIESDIHVRDLAKGIIRCPRLMYLSLSGVYTDNSTPTSDWDVSDRAELPDLTGLTITLKRQETSTRLRAPLAYILAHLCLPSLTLLQLRHVSPAPSLRSMRDPPSDRASVCALLAASQCKIDTLNIDIPGASPDELRAWLDIQGLSEVEALCLAGGAIDDSVLEALTWKHEEWDPSIRTANFRNRFRNLTQLGLAICNADIEEGVLFRMLGSRFWSPIPLTTVKDPYAKVELQQAHIWVREFTYNMESYEKMINACASRISGWALPGEERLLEFSVV